MVKAIVNILTTSDREDCLAICLQGLVMQSFKDFAINVISEYRPRVLNACEDVLDIRFIKVRSLSRAYRRNVALKHCGAEYVAFFDDDQFPCRNWLKELISTAESSSSIAAIGGPVVTDLRALVPWFVINPLNEKIKLRGTLLSKLYYYIMYDTKLFDVGRVINSSFTLGQFLGLGSNVMDVDILGCGNLLLRTEVAKKVGFDAGFKIANEDYDLVLRIKRLGYKILYNPRAYAIHIKRAYAKKVSSYTTYASGYDAARFLVKHVKMMTLELTLRTLLNQVSNNMYYLCSSLTRDKAYTFYIYGYLLGIISQLSDNNAYDDNSNR